MAVLTERGLVVEELTIAGYERIVKISDASSGLCGIICVHSTILGPALGGVRIYPYAHFVDALNDVLRLARGMTYKAAIAETHTGGGKAVIMADPHSQKTEELLHAFGRAVHAMEGKYICAEDVGSTPEDVAMIQSQTPYAVGLLHAKSSGNPAEFTAWGTFRGIQAACHKLFGSDSVDGRTIAIQGLGAVGSRLADRLFWAGAKLIVTDLMSSRAEEMAKRYGAKVCEPSCIYDVTCDLFAPCALGGVLNHEVIPRLRCRAIAGAANNQLLDNKDADALRARDILYAPDFVISAGGLINAANELCEEGYCASVARNKTHGIYDQLMMIFDIAERHQISTQDAALALAESRIQSGKGKRTVAPRFHHSLHWTC